ncbi:hypothetical protein [Pseudomonas fluorescens]|uniref:Uncharacterized protein n=2 Tax=Pseudomonas fluorescens TaxID=294 RepID=A0A944DGC8_PSEFL|nr:hypothetical protein [Pseudomonas fluorescens]MBT2298062.1 hypothetical protein [Pseudomonas fluorescens]MBT2309815.1 hypothetical protein [Pseudomonas fluorescens]MBT2314978.1 hypothetical protein [Pseudomonas fluorescens]MBT2327884.1 hypothetical protein [Pseudomonas fluorescens]MBT2345631.1 hypothetical protein [Pseudomonas fluorescens]
MRTLSVTSSTNPHAWADCEPEWVYVHLHAAELMSLRFNQDIIARSLSGSHWVSWEGCDLFLEQNQDLRLSAGTALIDGAGVLQIALAPAQEEPVKRLGQRLIAPFMPSLAEPLRIEIR